MKAAATDQSYANFYYSSIIKFSANRFFPFVSMAFAGILVANKNFDEFAFFSYITSAFIFPATVVTFMFRAVGNLSLEGGRTRQNIFMSSFFLVVACSFLVAAACYLITITSDREIDSLSKNYKALTFCYVYLIYISIYILTSFFNAYFEAHVKGNSSSIARLMNFCPFMFFSGAEFVLSDKENYSLTIAYLMLGCECLELAYYLYKSSTLKLWQLSFNHSVLRHLFIIGGPNGLGLASQRLAFFMANKKLFLIDKDLVSIFSIAVSITTLLIIPVSAFTQIHSIYVSRNGKPGLSSMVFRYLALSMFIPIAILAVWGIEIGQLFGVTAHMYKADPWLNPSLIFMFCCTSLMMLVSAHIRALGNTIITQIVMNAVVYIGYVGYIFRYADSSMPGSTLLTTYSLCYLLSFLFLGANVRYFQAKQLQPSL